MTRPVLHVITDESLQQRFTHEELAQRITEAGADFLQFREKRPKETQELLSTARELHQICRQSTATRLIVNDRADVAFAIGDCGVHLGENDLPVEIARQILGPERIIGGTLNHPESFSLRWARHFNYLGVGPVFDTNSKANPAPTLGLNALTELCQASPVDVIAIGNITLEYIDDVLATGVAGVAVLSAIVCSNDPAKQTQEFMKALGA
ncbi:MAG: thiamine phosphate synthase [Gammaproteobacteria bacterium]|nr:thiamine phosphate synthase [Gammaproteobacteria bacterium]MYF02517.1 thiamine phosphate synthase [Gammaproteobacteria bacterium]MYI78210.1 thiamine phosphate synthase [Gammaproteobacteria bacterium]